MISLSRIFLPLNYPTLLFSKFPKGKPYIYFNRALKRWSVMKTHRAATPLDKKAQAFVNRLNKERS